ncbi:MAG: precorrin-6A reductase [Candidatus Choladocola sp.]|nr:precorrin-6A reductase [Candidatus Choladocola sp.]
MKKDDLNEKRTSVLVFGGTIEGRQVSDYLTEEKIHHTVCVATEYGEEVLKKQEYLTVHQGRMNTEQMCSFLKKGAFSAVVDATHPYAVEVSENVRRACETENVPYLRYLRPSVGVGADDDVKDSDPLQMVRVNSTLEAARYLESQKGNIFLTTGSKELRIFTENVSDISRIFARVLPSAEVISGCRALGLEGKQICAMQGPFSAEINTAMMRQMNASFLVTKDTGNSGGFPEKIEAARELGVCAVVIRRPEEAGSGWEEITEKLRLLLEQQDGRSTCKRMVQDGQTNDCKDQKKQNLSEKSVISGEKQRHISCIGIGMGDMGTLTHEAAEEIRNAQVIFGAERILESIRSAFAFRDKKPELVTEYAGGRIAAYLQEHPEYERAVILMSGDVGFYSGARGIESAFHGRPVRYICGISSIVYFASRIPTPWQDAKLLSAHGKKINLLNCVNRYPKIILLVSGAEDVKQFCSELHQAGMDHVCVTVGTNLSYPDETIKRGHPEDFLHCETTGLHIMMLENEKAEYTVSPGIPDESFVRGKVPMTKEEIRILSVAKMNLTENAVVYDVGAGTGSVSVEIARLCTFGTVYAIERNPEGIALIRENSRKLGISNVITVEGTAPEAMKDLPSPTHAFIGGSSGNMRQIIAALREKNPDVRIVINTIALESIAELTLLLAELKIEDADIVHVSAAKSKVLGRYHMMGALNPVYIISFGGR